MSRKFLILNFIITLFLLAGCDILGYHETCRIYQDCIYLIDSNGSDLYKVVNLGHTDDSIMGGGGTLLPGADNIHFTSDDEKLVYGNDRKFYSINLDGSHNILLSDTLRVWGKPSISTDNQTIVFSAYKNGSLDIFIANFDASSLNNLTSTSVIDEKYPCFSPSGDEIIYVADIDSNSFICKQNINNGNIDTLLYSEADQLDYLCFPHDGTKIYFIEGNKLCSMDSDGTGQTILLDEILYSPSFSSDGSKVAYNDYNNLYVMNSDGSGITIVESDSYPRKPQISHDGNKIIYSLNSEIHAINSDGSDKQTIHRGSKHIFSSDSSKIAFSYYFLYKTIHSS